MNKEQSMVLEFHRKFGATINTVPKWPSHADQDLRDRLIKEESQEFSDADSIITIADAIADLLYVCYGAAICYGIDIEPIFAEVHRSNMSKVWPDGSVQKDKGGKILKPPTYSPANITLELVKQGMTQT